MKDAICTAAGLLGSLLAQAFGGWSAAMTTLVIFMAVDYLSGLVVAGVFRSSPKSNTGALDSRAGWQGLCRKAMTLVFVLVAHRLDLALGMTYLKDAVCVAFMVNELLSLLENAGLMGLPIPPVIRQAVEALNNKGGDSL